MWFLKASLLSLSVTVMFLSTACSAADVEETLRAAHVQVVGPMDRVYEFNQNLLRHLGTTTLEQVEVLCDKCGTLIANPILPAPSAEANYTFHRDAMHLNAFILAWGEVETKAPAAVMITFDMNYVTADCSKFVPQPCVSVPYCAGPPRGCAKTTTCKRCGT